MEDKEFVGYNLGHEWVCVVKGGKYLWNLHECSFSDYSRGARVLKGR